jgi:hypothetical protein
MAHEVVETESIIEQEVDETNEDKILVVATVEEKVQNESAGEEVAEKESIIEQKVDERNEDKILVVATIEEVVVDGSPIEEVTEEKLVEQEVNGDFKKKKKLH